MALPKDIVDRKYNSYREGLAGGVDVSTVEEFDYSHHNAATTGTTLKSGAGVLKRVVITSVGSGATITLYDNITASGDVIAEINGDAIGVYDFDVKFSNGLTLVVSATTAPKLTVVYK